MSFTLINALKELIKTYTVLANVAQATNNASDIAQAREKLMQINAIRLQMAVEAESREIFIEQKNIPASANVNNFNPVYFSKNDIKYTVVRIIAALETNVAATLQNQNAIEITREQTAWQQLFADIQRTNPRGQQIPFDLPETLFFRENEALRIGIKGQDQLGWLFIHGATIKDGFAENVPRDLQAEFINENNQTLYLPETQIIPIEFEFPDANAGTEATTASGETDLFSVKSQRSVLLTEVSISTTPLMRLTLTDEGKNQTICRNLEMAGFAANCQNPFTAYYPLPYPHLLRKGDRLKANIINGSLITATNSAANTLFYLAFKGITL